MFLFPGTDHQIKEDAEHKKIDLMMCTATGHGPAHGIQFLKNRFKGTL